MIIDKAYAGKVYIDLFGRHEIIVVLVDERFLGSQSLEGQGWRIGNQCIVYLLFIKIGTGRIYG